MSKTVKRVQLRILTVPDDTAILRTKSTPIARIDKKVVEFLSDLGATLRARRKPQGIGLSAVQVGKTFRAFATLLPEERVTRVGTPSSDRSLREDVGRGATTRQDPRQPELLFYLNPEIVDHSNDMTLGEEINPYNEDLTPDETPKPFLEGCLSIPHVYGPVKRWQWIKARAMVLSEKMYYNESGPAKQDLALPDRNEYNTFLLDGLTSRVFQHEIDHLNGILFTDRTLAEGNQLYREINKELEPVEF